VTWSRVASRLATALCALALCAGTAFAQEEQTTERTATSGIPFVVMVTRLSNEGLGVDPRAKELEGKLSAQGIKFDSVQVVEEKRIALQLDEVGTVDLPNGRKAHVRPLHQSEEEGVLLAVDVEGASKADVRAKPHHTVIFSAGPYQNGKLVLSIEPVE
jgi:hypothetical protein